MARRKNKKFIDPRYFMDEKTETINEALSRRSRRKERERLDELDESEDARHALLNLSDDVGNFRNTLTRETSMEEVSRALLDLQDRLEALAERL